MDAKWHKRESIMASRATEATLRSVDSVLGGKGVLGLKPRSAIDWIRMIRDGIPAAAIESILSVAGLSQSELARALAIPERTLARRKREGVLNADESSKLLRLARVISRAQEVFDDPAAAVDWLKAPNATLRGKTPLSLLDTDIGAESVLDTLGRIEHGVFA
jgi:putative toxin-antitoxin system antitoxin component (TIGR02293 family)